MKAKTTAKLCAVSFIAGAVLTPPFLRITRHQTEKVAMRGAKGYVELKQRVKRVGVATGRPGKYAVIATALAAHVAMDAANRWWSMVDEAEREVGDKKVDEFGFFRPPEPMATISDYVGSKS